MYPEQNTEYFETIANITVNSDSVSPHQKQKDSQEDCNIPYDKNKENTSINSSKTIDVSKTIKLATEKDFMTCLENIIE